MYHFRVNASSSESVPACPGKQHCYLEHRIKSYSACKLAAICSTLGGDSCADYGVEIDVGDDSKGPIKICDERILAEKDLGANEDGRVRVWYTGEWHSDVSCYVWCTEDGEIPVRPKADSLGGDFIKDLVSI